MSLFSKFRDAVKGGVTQAIRRIIPEPLKERAVKAVRKTIDYIDENLQKTNSIIDNWQHMNKREERFEAGDVLFNDIPSPYMEQYTSLKPTIEEDVIKKYKYPSEIRNAQKNIDELWNPDENPVYGQKEPVKRDIDPFTGEIEELSETYAQQLTGQNGNIAINVNGDYKYAMEMVTQALEELPPDQMVIIKVLADFNRKDNGITRHWKSATAVIEAEFAAETWIAGLAEIESEYNVTGVNPIQYVIEKIR